jgi:phosphomannomutase/phosphoglucomutase
VGKIFGTNGVRGVVNKEFTIELVSGIVASAGSLLGSEISIGIDGRTSSPMYRNAAVSALLSIGCNVHDMGVLPTPAFQYMIKKLNLDGGVMITASHNPPEFNGIKVMAGDGVEASRETETEIEDLYMKGGPNLVSWDRVGKLSFVDVLEPYIKAVLSQVEARVIKESSLKVALDTGNGVSVLTAPEVASRLGCKVYTINTEIDGSFPGRGSEPTPENLQALKALISATESNFGIGFDGDGDRSIVMDEKGDAVWGDKSLSLVTQWYMEKNPGGTIVTPVSSSSGIEDVAASHGGSVFWTKVGSVDVSRAMLSHGYLLGGEENGGIMYGPHHPVRDGTMVLALLLQILAEKKLPLSELIAMQPIYSKAKTKIPCPDNLKQDVLARLPNLADTSNIDTTDGVKLTYPDGSWVLFRPSGTEPVCRIYAEAKNESSVNKIIDRYTKKLLDLIKSLE